MGIWERHADFLSASVRKLEGSHLNLWHFRKEKEINFILRDDHDALAVIQKKAKKGGRHFFLQVGLYFFI
jgi:hypothetical protein